MARMTLRNVSGIKELKAKLADLEKKVRNKIASKAMRTGSKVIQKQVKANAPVKTGLVRNSIKVRAGKRRKGKIYFTVTCGSKNFVGKAFYGAIQEFGAPARNIEGKHFMERAFDDKQAEAGRTVIQMIKQGLESEGSK
jgi:HK97 gp10 family phage protein